MARTKAGITGGISGRINDVIGYRRNGKNIITGARKIQSINIIPSLLSNKNKMIGISNYVNRIRPMITREFIRIGYETKLDWDLIMKDNISHWNLAYTFAGNYLVIDHYRNVHQPVYSYGNFQSPNPAALLLSKLLPIKNFIGTLVQSRTRYYEYNNNLQNLDILVNVNSIGSATPIGLTPVGKFYAQIEGLRNVSQGYYSRQYFYVIVRT